MKRLVILLPVLTAFQVGASPAHAWTWPVDGPVLKSFVFGSDPYAPGQHRGIDIGAPAGVRVVTPAAGTVAFAGTVPQGGRTVTIETADGYSASLVHLGSVSVRRGEAVAEGAAVGTIGPSGEPEVAEPYVHLGIRTAADRHGYLHPLTFLPPRERAGAFEPVLATPSPAAAPAPEEDSPPSTAAEPDGEIDPPVAPVVPDVLPAVVAPPPAEASEAPAGEVEQVKVTVSDPAPAGAPSLDDPAPVERPAATAPADAVAAVPDPVATPVRGADVPGTSAPTPVEPATVEVSSPPTVVRPPTPETPAAPTSPTAPSAPAVPDRGASEAGPPGLASRRRPARPRPFEQRRIPLHEPREALMRLAIRLGNRLQRRRARRPRRRLPRAPRRQRKPMPRAPDRRHRRRADLPRPRLRPPLCPPPRRRPHQFRTRLQSPRRVLRLQAATRQAWSRPRPAKHPTLGEAPPRPRRTRRRRTWSRLRRRRSRRRRRQAPRKPRRRRRARRWARAARPRRSRSPLPRHRTLGRRRHPSVGLRRRPLCRSRPCVSGNVRKRAT